MCVQILNGVSPLQLRACLKLIKIENVYMATLFKVSACIRTDLFGNLKSCRPPEQFFDPVPICQSGLCTYANHRSYRLHNWDWKQFMGETDLMQAMARTLLP